MSSRSSTLITAGLLGAGTLIWALNARQMATHPELAAPLNPLGINRSPYGEVFAMAMQSPIDVYWHGAGVEGDHHDHDHDHCEHDRGHCEHDHDHEDSEAAEPATLRDRFVAFLSEIDHGLEQRTNPKPVTPAHQFYMRRQTEDKLRFAYQLDPAHYGNFNSYYFFLTQPTLGTRPELTQSAVMLAQHTIDYCLKQQDDPRPALTAAAAAANILEFMITEYRGGNQRHTLAQMRQNLALVDHCIHRFEEIATKWDATGNWSRLSEFRLQEIRDRIHFIRKVRVAHATTIDNLGKLPDSHQVSK